MPDNNAALIVKDVQAGIEVHRVLLEKVLPRQADVLDVGTQARSLTG
jgi:hypothetical protein